MATIKQLFGARRHEVKRNPVKAVFSSKIFAITCWSCCILFFSACDDGSPRKTVPVSNEVLDTIQSLPGQVSAAPALFENAFTRGTTQKLNKNNISLVGITIGKLKLMSGKLIACDPLHIDEYGLPFAQVFPAGEFPVQLSIAKVEHDERIAFGRVLFSAAPVTRWEIALRAGQKPLSQDADEVQGFAVDAGVVVFMDEGTKQLMNKSGVENLGNELFVEMNKHYHHKWKYAMFPFQNQNIAAFTTGLGDGRYTSYIGYDSTGKPCRLVTDFGFFDWKKPQH